MPLSDAKIEGSDDWWLMRLLTKFGDGLDRLGQLRDIYEGTDKVEVASGPGKAAFESFLEVSKLNIADLTVEAPMSRMIPRTVRTSIAGDTEGDKIVQEEFDDSHLYDQLPDTFTDMGVYGAGYLLATEEGLSRLSPWRAITEPDEARPWRSRAALFVSTAVETGLTMATLYLEEVQRDGTSKVAMRQAVSDVEGEIIPTNGKKWQPTEAWTWLDAGELIPWADEVPLLRLEAPGGFGQFERHVGAIRRLHILIYNRTVILTMQAFRQRYLSGKLPQYYPKGHPQEGQEIDYNAIFQYGPAAMIRLPEGVELKELQSTDTTQITAAIAQDLKNLAAATGTPLYMLVPDAVQGSATGAAIARETLTKKTGRLIQRAQDGVARALWLRCQARGVAGNDLGKIRVIWDPVEATSMAERAQAASQAANTLPIKTIWREIFQFTPEQIEQAELDLDDQQFSGVKQQFGGEAEVADGADDIADGGEPADHDHGSTVGGADNSLVGAVEAAAD